MPERILFDLGGNAYGWTNRFDLGGVRVTVCSGCRSLVLAGGEDGHMEFHRILLNIATELDQRRHA